MSNVAKLSLAVGLALVAAVLNAMWLSAEKQPAMFVAAASDLAAGDEITDDLLAPIPVPGDFDTLRASLVPYDGRGILLGSKAFRNYTQGDLFYQRDITAPLEGQKYEFLGPFRLISVGERFKQSNPERSEESYDPSGDSVTIAVSRKLDERTGRLLQAIDPSRKADGAGNFGRIVAVQVFPKDSQTAAAAAEDKDVVYQTISLDGVDSVPRVLLEGEIIRFVIPVNESL